MNMQNKNKRPEMTNAGIAASYPVSVTDEFGNTRKTHITGERPLTIYIDKQEIVTLMTLGKFPELLVMGYLYNQGFIKTVAEIKAVQVDWDIESATVVTTNGSDNWDEKLKKRTVTSGCGQGTVFGNIMEDLENINLTKPSLVQSSFYRLLHNIRLYNDVYKKSGAVHGCALCRGENIEIFIEDVGRHNATDTIAGHMLLEGIDGEDKSFYTTGRLTSEMVIKVAQMGISVLFSRAGITQMGFELSKKLGVTTIARAGGKHFLVYNGADTLIFDAKPPGKTAT
ncbi:MAG: formate dehydrogenase accessory sulfurtransferase FdhD [SAR324 cluster bacterium]|nr:formate dehydrogenase accessory sulfurtransferase FdhD [SAR324 cluster bacterium]MED5241337.1 formate dehydrogenase accessory sulfurtransferase FdhD [SAR324 cluster bacterium]MED5515318.1 formate dehydrogenase accessory sulfurtransferase FdhD [SAR324 cluster bacterium]MEE2600190.1 formate dehydrogenase accessory sulfurtransferase FdhD [SAR324 cluster bacterium]